MLFEKSAVGHPLKKFQMFPGVWRFIDLFTKALPPHATGPYPETDKPIRSHPV
jgi:hypothetical protein